MGMSAGSENFYHVLWPFPLGDTGAL